MLKEWSNSVRMCLAGIALAVLVPLFIESSALAQVPANDAPALNEQLLSRFAETWLPITDAIAMQDKEFDRTHVPSLNHALNALAVSDGADSTLDKAVASLGYADFDEWATIAQRAVVAAQWALQPPSQDELKRTLLALEADPDIPAEQKPSLAKDVSAAFQTALANKPSDADIAAAKAVLPLLKPIIVPEG